MMPTMAPGGSAKAQVLDQEPLAVALPQMLGLDHELARARARRDDDLGLVGGALAALGEERLVGADAGLALGLARARALADPLELAGKLALAPGLLFPLELEALLLLLEPGRVVALERDAAPAVELEDPAGGVVEEIAVVGDRDHGPVVLGEEALEPGDRLRVEMVGRLVEEEQIGVPEEEPAERHPAALPAREGRDPHLARRAAQRVHRDLDLALELPAVARVDLLLELRLLGDEGIHPHLVEGLGEARTHRLEALEECFLLGDPVEHVAHHVLGRVELRLLGQEPDGHPLGRPGLAREVALQARHDAQQGRFAGPVRAEHADLGPRQERKANILEHLAAARKGLGEAVHDVDVLVGSHAALRKVVGGSAAF